MCEMKTVLVLVCLILLVTASSCMYWVYLEKKNGTEQRNENSKSLRKRLQEVLIERWRLLLSN